MNMKTFKNLIELITSKYENVKSINTEENNIYTTLIVSPPGVRENYSIKGFSKKN